MEAKLINIDGESKFKDVSIIPMHTAEHILNATMVHKYGCSRSKNAHIEKKKSKCDYVLLSEPSAEEIQEIEEQVNRVIKRDLPVQARIVTREQAEELVDLSKLPPSVGAKLRLVEIGDYDVCACIGNHVKSTAEIGDFRISTYDYSNGVLRLRFKLKNSAPGY